MVPVIRFELRSKLIQTLAQRRLAREGFARHILIAAPPQNLKQPARFKVTRLEMQQFAFTFKQIHHGMNDTRGRAGAAPTGAIKRANVVASPARRSKVPVTLRPPTRCAMRTVSAVLQLIDGKKLIVSVPSPAPPTFTMAVYPGPNRVLDLRRRSPRVMYVERDRRKTNEPVTVERRRGGSS